MKKALRISFLSFCFLTLGTSFSAAQPYWNEWINFSQKYYKIPVTQNGIYRLDHQTLTNAGINLSLINPKNIQLFFRGQEQYIYVKGEGDNVFNTSDYIEFYGQKNDGSLDSNLYKGDLYNQPVKQPNPYYSLFNDTSVYFLTWNVSSSNKRITDVADTAYSSYPQQTSYFIKEQIIENHSEYFYGKATITNINFPDYHETEGWGSLRFNLGSQNSNTSAFNTTNICTTCPVPVELKIAVMGASDDPNNNPFTNPDHHLEIKYKNISGNFVAIDTADFDGYRLFDSSYTFSASAFGPSTDVVVKALSGNFSTSSNSVPYAVLKFPHNTNLENKSYYEMFVPDNGAQAKSNYSFTNFNDLGDSVHVYDFTNHVRITVTKNGNYKALIQNSLNSSEKFCVIKSDANYLPVLSIKPAGSNGTFTNYFSQATDSAFIIVTHKSLMGDANNGVIAYKNYRSSAAGGSHNVLIADIDELYEQFAYGISKHPFSVRHFAEYCLDTFPTAPHNLFLIGKSIQTNLMRNSSAYSDPTGINYDNCLVPSFGYPTSDNMLVSVLNGNLLTPGIPVGRLAANNLNDINTYLHKVDEYEHPLPNPDEWMKQAIHLAGGDSQGLTNWILQQLNGYKATYEDTCFGGYVHTFAKNSSAPSQTSFTDSIRALINNGISIITFFGHSSAQVFDFNILPPDEYDNTNGKYPFMCADGCIAGDIHQPIQNGISSSENYVLSNKGMIGFLASSGPGTPGDLALFSSFFYKGFSHHLYGKSVGKVISATIDSVEGSGTDPLRNAVCLEMTLHGDPAIIIHASKLPDYAVSSASVYFEPAYVSTDLDSFNMNVIVTNIGKATNDSVKVDITRTFVDGTSLSYSDTVPRIYFKDTVTFRLPVDPLRGPGLNKFEVRVDPLNTINEIENIVNNNITAPNEVPLLIYSGDIIPVYPYKYAIVPNDTITIKAYTANPFASNTRYIFEIDTTDLYNSPQYKKQYVTQMGAVVKAQYNLWSSPLMLADSTVYFWRVRRDTSDMVNFRWRESSFQYIPDKRGWGQSHFFQFLKGDRFQYIDTNRLGRSFDFDYQVHSFQISAYNYNALGLPSSIYFDASDQVSYWSFLAATGNPAPHVLVSVFDPITGAAWKNPGGGFYGDFPISAGTRRFEFKTGTSAEQESLRRFLQDTIPCGSKVILFCDNGHNLGDLLGGNISTTNPGLVQAFQSIGGAQFPNVKNNYPYILAGRKCGTAVESVGDSLTASLFLYDTMAVKREEGYIFSEIIGPASKWKSYHWKWQSPEVTSNPSLAVYDSIKTNILGIKLNGTVDTLFKNIPQSLLDIYNLDSAINAATYPYLKLTAWVKDSVLRTPARLKFWRVYYDGVPDASLNPSKGFAFYNSAVQQGDSIKMKVAVENIGDYDMDSLWVNFWVYDSHNSKMLLDSVKMDSLLIDSIQIPEFKFSTENIPGGLNSVWIEANPFNAEHQLEQYHFNNIGTIPFNVGVDAINPLLDVTFDGVHIMNGDIVSAKPSILIKLKDENTFLALDDTTDFEVFLKKPSQTSYSRIHFGSQMTFEKAVLPNNSCKINYTPALPDGKYDLKVQAKDKSGNNSGNVEYKITFEVINKPSVTSVLNYPNPFSTSTKFVFTLTGSEVPDYFKIQILTVSGKIVREINKYQLGPIHIGRNITEYAWDGKDEFGDQLANGLYIYRVQTQLNGKALDHRETDADTYFNQGYGKMYLIR